MRHASSKDAEEALEEALQGLEGIVMTPPDDPRLSALKDDIRRTIQTVPVRKEQSPRRRRIRIAK